MFHTAGKGIECLFQAVGKGLAFGLYELDALLERTFNLTENVQNFISKIIMEDPRNLQKLVSFKEYYRRKYSQLSNDKKSLVMTPDEMDKKINECLQAAATMQVILKEKPAAEEKVVPIPA